MTALATDEAELVLAEEAEEAATEVDAVVTGAWIWPSEICVTTAAEAAAADAAAMASEKRMMLDCQAIFLEQEKRRVKGSAGEEYIPHAEGFLPWWIHIWYDHLLRY